MIDKSITILLLLILISTFSYSHSGRTDSNGGHTNRKTGEYHYHNSGYKKQSSTPSYNKPTKEIKTLKGELRERAIYSYYREANENVGALDCNLVKYERDVSQETKRYIKRRDGHQCVICGSTYKLEVDHKRALMNGGDNSIANLATLCDDCHTAKTRLDNIIRRKRDRMCR